MKKIIAVILSVLLGCVFLFSAWSKLYPIEPFEYTFVEFGIGGWHASVIIARLFIGFEFACGLLLVTNLWLRRFTIPLVASVLMLFNIYLLIQLYRFGNTGNCGCFGDYYQMSPLLGILKNIVMLGVAAMIYFFHPGFRFRGMPAVTALFVALAMGTPFVLNPVDFETADQLYSGKLNYKLDLDMLYHDVKNAPPKVELRKGKWVIAFMSLTCPHCRLAAKKLHVMKERNPSLPIYMVLNGKPEFQKPFFEDTRATNIQWSIFNGGERFVHLAGVQLPAIFWVDNSIVVHRSNAMLMQQSDIEAWLNKK